MKMYKLILFSFLLAGIYACTSDFDKINTNPNAITQNEASARYFLTVPQYRLYGPDRFPYWRAQLIHADRYAGQVTFGNHSSWWSDELCYSYNGAYTDAAWGWLAGYIGSLDTYMKFTQEGGEFENPNMYAVGQIIKSLYFQMYTDVFGEIPYSEAAKEGVLLPKYDTQKDIYVGIINDLDEAMATIGDKENTGDGIQNIGDNDLYYDGDLQKWKKLANTLKLRIATRAMGANGADFAQAAMQEALQGPLLTDEADNALLPKDGEISQWGSAAYGDVWYNFGAGSDWKVSEVLIKYLLDNNDPRLSQYAKPAAGGTITLPRPDQTNSPDDYALYPKRAQFIIDQIESQGVELEVDNSGEEWTVTMPENQYYVGQPVRLGGQISSLVRYDFFSSPAEWVIQQKNKGLPIFPEIVMTTAESYFLQARASVNGMGSGDAQTLFQNGIRQAMKLWKVSDGDIDAYLADAPLAQLNGSTEENLEKIAVQSWIASYTDGFEAWAIVRKTGYPKELAEGVSDSEIFGLGDINGAYPQRLRYGSGAYSNNGDNVEAAVSRQGADRQDTKLWFVK